jgi:hypothetical protein
MENVKSSAVDAAARKSWIEPAIHSLDISETAAFPNLGADARGNPAADSQRS